MTDGSPHSKGRELTQIRVPVPIKIPYPHFAMIAIDHAGDIKYHTSFSAERDCYHIFDRDVKERFLQLADTRRGALSEVDKDSELDERRVDLRIGDKETVKAYYYAAFRGFQQINCRTLSRAWIRFIEPKKQAMYPYKKGPVTKPPWWPADVEHREPDHLKTPCRVQLLVHILKLCTVTADQLEDAGKDVRRQITPVERWEILEEICMVRRMEERYERGEIDANTTVNVVNRSKKRVSSSSAGVTSPTSFD
ncbi:conserved hypothetical protein [Coccidioides posadasii str. Silveira]|uniref:Subtelomeric hrmA-associated cluster protein AFUB-079030/YDR124W-like helical bundle domain-containing protein n=1 Tax=Coccidioides posadasii (strain RMSCC 757 / Silveira) TaxID=443226 RepID=E9D513_COCPS|nr:conserved hypothetical protein [Coccidioides posadasii str. Silveira]